MTSRPDQIADRIEGWITSEFPDRSPAEIATALDMARRRITSRSMANPADAATITADDIISTDGETIGPITRGQLFDAVHAWEQISQQGGSPVRSLWHHTPDFAIHVRYETPAQGQDAHYVQLTGYHQDTRPGQEHSEDALVRALAHWVGPTSRPNIA